jgi:hypothetical protein
MGVLDHQLMIGEESTYGTPVVVNRTFEYNSEGIEDTFARTEGDPLRKGLQVPRSDRFTPYYAGGAGPIELDVMTKGFGILFKHMLGSIATSGPTDTAYTHTATLGELFGKSLTVQVARPFYPSGTVQAFTFEGGKITEWTLSNSVENNLVLECGLDFEQVKTNTALATAAYPSAMENFTWAGGSILVGGADVGFCVNEISIAGNNSLNVDRRCISNGADKKEPAVNGRREITFSLSGDFASNAHRDRAAALTAAGALAEIKAAWIAPTLIGTTTYPKVEVTLGTARFDEWKASAGGAEGIQQELTGVARDNGVVQPISIAYTTADTTP